MISVYTLEIRESGDVFEPSVSTNLMSPWRNSPLRSRSRPSRDVSKSLLSIRIASSVVSVSRRTFPQHLIECNRSWTIVVFGKKNEWTEKFLQFRNASSSAYVSGFLTSIFCGVVTGGAAASHSPSSDPTRILLRTNNLIRRKIFIVVTSTNIFVGVVVSTLDSTAINFPSKSKSTQIRQCWSCPITIIHNTFRSSEIHVIVGSVAVLVRNCALGMRTRVTPVLYADFLCHLGVEVISRGVFAGFRGGRWEDGLSSTARNT